MLPRHDLSGNEKKLLETIKDFIAKDIRTHHTIADLAEQFGINRDKLKKQFHQHTGTGLYEYLKQVRLERSVSLLDETGKTVEVIAHLSGYTNASSFIHAFKKQYGITPLQYRTNGLPLG